MTSSSYEKLRPRRRLSWLLEDIAGWCVLIFVFAAIVSMPFLLTADYRSIEPLDMYRLTVQRYDRDYCRCAVDTGVELVAKRDNDTVCLSGRGNVSYTAIQYEWTPNKADKTSKIKGVNFGRCELRGFETDDCFGEAALDIPDAQAVSPQVCHYPDSIDANQPRKIKSLSLECLGEIEESGGEESSETR